MAERKAVRSLKVLLLPGAEKLAKVNFDDTIKGLERAAKFARIVYQNTLDQIYREGMLERAVKNSAGIPLPGEAEDGS